MSTRSKAVAAVCAVAAFTGCGGGAGGDGGSPASGRLVDGATFTFALGTDPGSLDTAVNPNASAIAIAPFAYDALVATDEGTKIVGNLATKWSVAPRRMEFRIRAGVTCADGSPVTPSVIAKSFAHLKDPKVQSPVFGSMTEWSVRADDARGTVTFRLAEPVGFPLESIADVPVVCGAGLENRKLVREGTNGSGPYVLTKAASNDRYELELREDYAWGPGGMTAKTKGLPAKVVFRVVPDAATTANLFVAGEIDAAEVTHVGAERVRSAGRVITAESAAVGQVAYNHEPDRPTGDVAVRRALTMAVDRESAAKVARGETAGNLVAAISNPCPDPDNQAAIPAYDPAAAARTLDEAGWRRGANGIRTKDGERLKIVAPIAAESIPEDWMPAAELILDAWRDLGIEVASRKLAGTAFIQAVTDGDFDALPMWGAGDPNPAALRAYITGPPPPDGNNITRLYNDEYDRISAQALREASREEACPLWNAAERAIYADAGLIPVFASNVHYAVAKPVELRLTTYGVVPASIRMHEG